jgi:hypothetical protein
MSTGATDTDACNSFITNEYYSSNLNTGGTLYTDAGGNNVASSGFYARFGQVYNVGAAGSITAVTNCPVSYTFTSGSTSLDACNADQINTTILWSNDAILTVGSRLFTDNSRTIPAQSKYYANIFGSPKSVYEVGVDGITFMSGSVLSVGSCPTTTTTTTAGTTTTTTGGTTTTTSTTTTAGTTTTTAGTTTTTAGTTTTTAGTTTTTTTTAAPTTTTTTAGTTTTTTTTAGTTTTTTIP